MGKRFWRNKMNRTNLIFLSFILLLGLSYYQSIHFDFTRLDDYEQVVNNSNIRSLNFSKLSAIFQSTSVGMYQPFTTLIYAIIYSVFGLNPIAYHLTSLVFHLLNGILIYALLKRFNIQPLMRLLLTGIFLFHPMQVESVAWVSAFSNLVFSCFFLGGLRAYWHFKVKEKKSFYFLSILLFLIACFSKSSAVVFPLILVLIDYFQDGKFRLKSVINKIPFLAISIVFGLITLSSREAAGHLSDLSVGFDLIDRFFLLCYTVLFYPFKFLFPANLSVFYPYPEVFGGLLPLQYYLSAVLLAFLFYLFWKYKAKKQLLFGLGFYLFSIAPVLHFIPVGNQLTTDRYIYLPMLGILLIFEFITRPYLRTQKAFYALFLLPLLFAVISHHRAAIWESDEKIWKDVLQQYPKVAQAHNNLGSALLEEGETAKALQHFNRAIALKPYYADAHINKGNLLAQSGKSEQAVKAFSRAIELRPHANAYFNRGNEYSRQGRYNLAIADYSKSIQLKAGADAYTNRAFAYVQIREMKKARADVKEAVLLSPDYHQAYLIEGMSYHLENQIQLACQAFEKAIAKGNENARKVYEKLCR